MDTKRKYEKGTYIISRNPWGIYVSAAAICPDGILRKVKRISITSDTFFSIPASVAFKGKTIAGYLTFESDSGLSTDENQYISFRPYLNGKNGKLFSEKV